MGAKWDIVFTFVSLVLSLADLGLIIWVLHDYYTGGDIYWFTFTLVIALVPSLLLNCFSVVFFGWDAKGDTPSWQWTIRIVVAILQLSTPYRYGKL